MADTTCPPTLVTGATLASFVGVGSVPGVEHYYY